MESSVPMILPKGIVVNTTDVYKEVASYPTVPADKIWEYWHVYTITNKKLKDPTARRLENFWWQVWGSDRRYLSGRTLARIYEDISAGPTFVPLQGPPNRWEGPNVPPLTRQMVMAHLSQEQNEQPNNTTPPPPARPADSSVKNVSSASKPPPTHPILKKPRRPSATGPKPTARFVSPQESCFISPIHFNTEDENGVEAEGSIANAGLGMVPIVSKKKRRSGSATKKRSIRTSLHSPILEAEGTRESSVSAGSCTAGPPPPVSPIAERASRQSPAVEDGISERAKPSAKALGKRPAVPRTVAAENEGQEKARSPPAAPMRRQAPPGPGHAAVSRVHFSPSDGGHPRVSSSTLKDATGILSPPAMEAAPAMGRSQSHNGYGLPLDRIHNKAPSTGLWTGATATTTNVAAQGSIIDQSGSFPRPSALGASLNDTFLSSGSSPSSLLEPRLTPTPPGPSASVPMGRTRSQLTLLLERDKTRIGDQSRPRS